MNAGELLQAVTAAGGQLRASDSRIVFTGPADLRERFRTDLVRLKPELLALLNCTCEVFEGFRYLCPAHQQTPTGKVLVEPARDGQMDDLVQKAAALFGGRPLAGEP